MIITLESAVKISFQGCYMLQNGVPKFSKLFLMTNFFSANHKDIFKTMFLPCYIQINGFPLNIYTKILHKNTFHNLPEFTSKWSFVL